MLSSVPSMVKILNLDLAPEFFPRILWVQLSQLPQQFLSLLVARHRHRNLHFDNLVAPQSILGSRRHALLPQPKLLARLRPRSNLQHAPPINRGHFNLCSQRRFRHRHRYCDVDVVALAPEQWVLIYADDHVEIADRTAPQPGIAFSRNPNALPVAGSGLDADLHRSRALDAAFTAADPAGRSVLPRPTSSRAGDIRLYPAASLFDRPLAMTLRTLSRSLDLSITVAASANIAPGDIQLHHSAPDRRPERHVDLVLKIAAGFRSLVDRLTAAATGENAGEDIAEPATP